MDAEALVGDGSGEEKREVVHCMAMACTHVL